MKLLYWLALLLFGLGLTAHMASYFPESDGVLWNVRSQWLLLATAALLTVTLCVYIVRVGLPLPRAGPPGAANESINTRLQADIPRISRLLLAVFFAYAILNFILCMVLLEGGGVNASQTGHQLISHGQVLRHLTDAEFLFMEAVQARIFSGHLILAGWFAVVAIGWLADKGTFKRFDPPKDASPGKTNA